MDRSCNQNGKGKSALKILKSKLIGKRPLGRPKHRWEDNTRMNLKEIGIDMRNWVDSAQDKECGTESYGSISHGII